MCNKCMKIGGAIFLVLGIVFIMKDMGKWDFWGINWWSAVLLVYGLVHIASSMCKDCEAVRKGK